MKTNDGTRPGARVSDSRACWIVVAALLTGATAPAVAQVVGEFDLLIYDARRGETVAVTDTPGYGEFNADFSPNGKTLVHEAIEATTFSAMLMLTDVDTGISVPLPDTDGGNDAAYSPNGRYIAFDRANAGEPSIYLMPAAGGTPVLLRPLGLAPAWSNNSHRLAFLDVTDGSIRTIDIRTGAETNLGSVGVYGDFPDWSPNGRWIAYQTFGGDLKAVPVTVDGEPRGTPIYLTLDGWLDSSPSFSNNSKTIVFASDRMSFDVDLWTLELGEATQPECGVPDVGNDPAEAFGAPVFLRGSMNSWAADDDSLFVNLGGGEYEAQILLPAGASDFKVASADWVAADFAPPAPVELGVPQVMVPAPGGNPTGMIDVTDSGCYSFRMDASNPGAPVLLVTLVEAAPIGAPTTRLTGAPGPADVDPAYSNNGRYVVYSGVRDPTP